MHSPATPSEVVTVERIAPGGDGLGCLSSGEIVFVASTAPGDQVEIASVARRKGALHAEVGLVRCPGPHRIEPSCPLVSRCGGCDLMHLSPEGQKQAKLGILSDALRRAGGHLPELPAIEYVQSGNGFSYRSRLRLHVDPDGNVGFVSTRSKNIVLVHECLVAMPLLNSALSHLAAASAQSRRLLQLCDQIELRAADAEPRLLARLFPKPKLQLQAQHFTEVFPKNARIVVVGTLDDDRTIQQYRLPFDLTLSAPACAFTQVNPGVNALLVQAIVEAAVVRNLHSFVDAYAGAGNFTLPLLAAGLTGESIDCAPAGILAARSVARDRGLPFDGFQVGDAKTVLESFVRNRRTFDFVLLDPPRSGAKDVLSQVLQLRPQLTALIACDPVSLARDLRILIDAGGNVENVVAYDLFPQTHHLETLALVDLP